MKKRTLALAAAFALAAVATGCSGQEKEAETQAAASSQAGAGAEGETAGSADAKSDLEATRYENILSSGVLKIGTEGTYKPFTYHDENNELCGYDVEVGKMIGDKLGVKTEFSEITWEGLLTSLDTGTVDLVLNQVGVTPEREEKYDFSDPYLYSYIALITLDDNEEITDWESAEGKKTSLNVSSNYAGIAEQYGMDITASDTFSKDIELLLAGRTDCVINNTIAFNDFLTQKPDTPIKIVAVQETPDTVAIPIPKGNEDLLEAVNQAIAELREDGTLTELSEKYLGKDFSREMTLEELTQ
ncbi:amino acid ABC transporter substrate-binding protein [Clostridium sp. AM29-11AC]|uniref:transporter substrate-binding domain-containing protein n=1 Tax=unclassified Clostridium TaxID=2614128 RepID=UPI0001CE5872|nr:transporter substrate-binding domain-containing protein [Clostridium sp. AM29-11AC]RHT59630.1 amino acid ABC transporter substrate-binding protein [Clostridium sp. AM29-11AC]CBL36248.1 ABC-type amino acid transport/signal transduction systems, periplasmic component/domain [butyrate-producing bacterium SM4/1]